MHDLVSTLFCYTLAQRAYDERENEKSSSSQQEILKNWFRRFGLKDEEWGTQVANKISGLNSKKQDEGQQL